MSNPKIIEKKKQVIEEIAQKLEKANGAYFADFKGMNVMQINEMRRAFDKEEIEYKVYKNNYIELALKDNPLLEQLKDILVGNTAIAFSYDDPVSPARIMKDFTKKYKKPNIKSAIVEGKFFDQTKVRLLANLPTKEVLLSQVVAGIQGPISNLVYSLDGILSNFVLTLQAIKEKKENN